MESLRFEKTHIQEGNRTEDSEFFAVEEAEKLEARLREEIQPLYERLLEHPAITEALAILDTLPEHLIYHTKEHTLDVIEETVLFAHAGGENYDVIEQQAIAAAWHDVGFIERDKENEIVAIEKFKKSVAYQTLPSKLCDEIIANIQDTEIVMRDGVPHLEKRHGIHGYILDGDVSNFGRKDFFEKRQFVAEELQLDLDDPEVKKRFYRFAINLLKNHTWKTTSAYQLREAQRIKNLEQAEKEWSELIN